MLITKNPLTLQSISAFGIYSDSLGEKIIGNYQVFGAVVTGEDLIHMTMQEPDIYVGIQNNGPFIVDNQIHADNHIKLELLNRLINRIMLYDSPAFTYQDEVFVTSVLQKLGVADVNEFMRLVKLHMEKNELSVSLINKYFEEGREFAYTVNELLENPIYEKQELEIIKNEYRSDRYLHNEIFKRLMTAECSNAVYTYQNPVRTKESVVKSFHDMEWMRQADRIQLSQLKENIFYQTNPAVFCDYSAYETRPLAAGELTQQKVIGRMSAAILENIVNAVSYELQYEYGSTEVWKNYSRIFYGSSENTLERFRYFQTGSGISPERIREYEVRMTELARDELRLTQLLEFVNRYDVLQEDDTLYEDMTRNILLSVLENQNLQKQLTREIQMAQQANAWEQPDSYYLEEENSYINELNRFDEAYRILRQKKNENYFSTVTEEHVWNPDIVFPKDSRPVGSLPAAAQNKPVIDGQIQKAADSGDAVFEIIRRYAESEGAFDVPLMENIELLEQINQHNLYMKQLLDSKEPAKDTHRRVVVDKAQAREAALRALEQPEQVLQEIYENMLEEGKGIPNEIPKEIERILSITDEKTRIFYERLMGYRDDAQDSGSEIQETYKDAPIDADTEHPQASPVYERALTKEEREQFEDFQKQVYLLLHRIERKESAYRTYRETLAVQAREIVENTQRELLRHETTDIHNINIDEMISLEHLHMVQREHAVILHTREREAQLVHKTREQTKQEFVEEVLETLENSSLLKKNIEEKNEETQLTQRQLENIRNEIITQSREHVAHMVERSMKTQVHEISDMVYLELERRLKNEQRRRGY